MDTQPILPSLEQIKDLRSLGWSSQGLHLTLSGKQTDMVLPVPDKHWLVGMPVFSRECAGFVSRDGANCWWNAISSKRKAVVVKIQNNVLFCSLIDEETLLLGCGDGCHVSKLKLISLEDFKVISETEIEPIYPISNIDDEGNGCLIAVAKMCKVRIIIELSDTPETSITIENIRPSGPTLDYFVTTSTERNIPIPIITSSFPTQIVIWVQGGPFSWMDWDLMDSYFKKFDQDVVLCCPQFPGSLGFSDDWVVELDEDWVSRCFYDDVHEICIYLQNRFGQLPISIVGYSWGGFIAIRSFERGLIKKCFLINPLLKVGDLLEHQNKENDLLLSYFEIESKTDPRLESWKTNLDRPFIQDPNLFFFFSEKDEILPNSKTLHDIQSGRYCAKNVYVCKGAKHKDLGECGSLELELFLKQGLLSS